MPEGLPEGHWFAPQAWEIDRLHVLTEEHFGPILHALRYEPAPLDALLDSINATGHGLTSGIHSRVPAVYEQVVRRVAAGDAYVNRSMIGATVGVQPFGGGVSPAPAQRRAVHGA